MSSKIEELTKLTLSHIDRKLLSKEREFQNSKWWDYRTMHPLEATYLYAEAFKQAKKDAIKRRFDLYKGENTKGLKNEDFLKCNKQVITGLWKGRQMADSLGIPYSFYCNKAFRYTETHLWENLPQPCHLYSNKRPYEEARTMIEDIGVRWMDYGKDQILLAESDFYLARNYNNHPAQIAYRKHLLNQLKLRPMRAVAICTLVYERKHLPESIIELNFKEDGAALLLEAKKILPDIK